MTRFECPLLSPPPQQQEIPDDAPYPIFSSCSPTLISRVEIRDMDISCGFQLSPGPPLPEIPEGVDIYPQFDPMSAISSPVAFFSALSPEKKEEDNLSQESEGSVNLFPSPPT